VLIRRQTEQRIEASLSRRVADMLRRSGVPTTSDLDESAARDDLDRMLLRIVAQNKHEPVANLFFVRRLPPELYERCLRDELEQRPQ
jgi:hypothetical protein